MIKTREFKSISIIGLGYIGLPTAAVFASCGVRVIGVDVNQHTVDTINQGKVHIVEPELDDLVHSVVSKGYLRATTKPEPADAFLIAVPTPFKVGPSGPHHPDTDYIESAAKAIAPVLKSGDLVVLESTSPVGATEKMAAWMAEIRPDLTFPQTNGEHSDIRVAHCPERVLPGKVLRELVQNDRVIGGMTPKCSELATRLYKTFVHGECVITNARTAEMCKLTENSFRDVNIAFANELSVICDTLKIDVWELIRLANLHPRVNILQPGPGVGGHCIAVDPWFIISQTPELATLIRAARNVNDSKPKWIIAKIEQAIAEYLKDNPGKKQDNITIACLGLAFKPDIDDLRESPALDISLQIAKQHNGTVLVVEPYINIIPAQLEDHARLVTLDVAIELAEILVVLVGHKEFKGKQLKNWKNKIIIDACGIYS
jgi:UDP-N-acetyl-D-mannosaminuronic acid dehydrogenase